MKNGYYLYETHSHTSASSACARISPAELARLYHAHGYDGLMVTDHFFNGTSSVPRDLPWAERVKRFFRGYEEAKEEGDKLGLKVFGGWEYRLGDSDYLTYGLDADWLIANPDVMDIDIFEYAERVHRDGGFIVHAHPFREGGIRMFHLMPRFVDAVEIYNGSTRTAEENARGEWYAESFDLPGTCGSDTHNVDHTVCGIALKRPLESLGDYFAALKNREAAIFRNIDTFAEEVAACERD